VKKQRPCVYLEKAKLSTYKTDDENIEQVSQFKYSGRGIADDAYSVKDIWARTAMAKTQKNFLIEKLNYTQKIQIVMSTVWNIALYSAIPRTRLVKTATGKPVSNW